MVKNYVVNKDLYKLFGIEKEKSFLLLKNFDNKKDVYVANSNKINVNDINDFIKFNAKIYVNNFDYKEYFNANFYQLTTVFLFTNCQNRNCNEDENIYRNCIKKFYKKNHENKNFDKILNFFKIDVNNNNNTDNKKNFENIVIKSFKVIGISINLDGSEDNLIIHHHEIYDEIISPLDVNIIDEEFKTIKENVE